VTLCLGLIHAMHSHGREVTCLKDGPDKRSEGLGVLPSDYFHTDHSLRSFCTCRVLLTVIVTPLSAVVLCPEYNGTSLLNPE
jgi:hypothetical protein